jgi:hypothetical protein
MTYSHQAKLPPVRVVITCQLIASSILYVLGSLVGTILGVVLGEAVVVLDILDDVTELLALGDFCTISVSRVFVCWMIKMEQTE